MEDRFSLTCPCCKSHLVIDREKGIIIEFKETKVDEKKESFDERLKNLEDEKKRTEEKFQESIRIEKEKKATLEQKFNDLFAKAKDEPIEPQKRDIDLD